MSNAQFPLILDASDLARHLQDENILLVDLSLPQTYVQYHIPGAVFLDYNWIVHKEEPRMGLLPDQAQLDNVLGAYGVSPEKHVVAYDDEGGGRAARFLWTLDCVGFANYSLLDGGIHAWVASKHPVDSRIVFPKPGSFQVRLDDAPVADRQYILDHMNRDDTVILDARSPQEYAGKKVFAARGGHIPGAVNFEWTEAMDAQRNLRLKPAEELAARLAELGVTPEKTVVCHCQTHHRSAHTYILLKSLGFNHVKGYPGSWSDWGNDPNTPIV